MRSHAQVHWSHLAAVCCNSNPQNQKLFSDFLAENTKGATDLQEDYAKVVADSWDKFFASDCGSDDPTCDLAHEQLGRWARESPSGISPGCLLQCCGMPLAHAGTAGCMLCTDAGAATYLLLRPGRGAAGF